MAIQISVASDMCEAEQFVSWLNQRGYNSETNSSTGNYVDGVWTSVDAEASELLNRLWDLYCSDC